MIYYGASGQDAGVEVGLAAGAGVRCWARGPAEGPGLHAARRGQRLGGRRGGRLDLVGRVLAHAAAAWAGLNAEPDAAVRRLGGALLRRKG